MDQERKQRNQRISLLVIEILVILFLHCASYSTVEMVKLTTEGMNVEFPLGAYFALFLVETKILLGILVSGVFLICLNELKNRNKIQKERITQTVCLLLFLVHLVTLYFLYDFMGQIHGSEMGIKNFIYYNIFLWLDYLGL